MLRSTLPNQPIPVQDEGRVTVQPVFNIRKYHAGLNAESSTGAIFAIQVPERPAATMETGRLSLDLPIISFLSHI